MKKGNIQSFLELIGEKSDYYDLGVCGQNLKAIAGTGLYKNNIGKKRPDTYLLEVLETGKQITLESRYRSEKCNNCKNNTVCPYKAVVYYPLKKDGIIEGVAYKMYKKLPLYNEIVNEQRRIQKISTIIVDLLYSYNENFYNKWKIYTELLLNSMDKPLIIFNSEGKLDKINRNATEIINIEESEYDDIDVDKCLSILKKSLNKYGDKKKYRMNIFRRTGFGDIYELKDDANRKADHISYDFPKIVGNSSIIKDIIYKCEVISKTNSNVLLTGETGTGKELFARMIHAKSQRNSKKMVTLNCGSIPEGLLESELFGYVGGAFTGANPKGKKGKFQIAHEGTIFLDEIAELPLRLQAKFLRVLENNSIDSLGSAESTEIDVRVIAATNKDLELMVRDGKFREDLFYRINVMHLAIPPLRSRQDDIPLLVNHFVRNYSKYLTKNIKINDELLNAMKNYAWPGNIRELRNAIEYAMAFVDSEYLGMENMPQHFCDKCNYHDNSTLENKSLKDLEKKVIVSSLKLYGNSVGAKKKVAESMGIGLATLYRKMKKYNININQL